MQTVRLSSKNQIVLPRESREAMHLKGRDELLVVVKGEVTVIMPKPAKHSSALSGAGKGVYPGDYLKKERKSW
ncbi:MAG TPA: AbrB/MazE/SpoVT family DNA-binding domain-containing protein [Thermodesulfovibrionales bacterium]|nr:AbrB/MazE/SpoVT family DNA-binding domain-containing protein [Thermodesulfovibrionales bacterium]